MPQRIRLTLPTEWRQYFMDAENGRTPDPAFGYVEWRAWVSDNPHFRFIDAGDDFDTDDHQMPGYEDEELICREFLFEFGGSSSSHPMRRELRISVPAPTKLPLP